MKTKKTAFIIGLSTFTVLVLSACSFGGNTNPKVTVDEKSRRIDDSAYAFNVIIPREWDIIEKKDFTKEVPANTEIAFRNNIKNEDFTANVSILKNPLQKTRETLEYAKQVIAAEKTGLYNYKEIKRDTYQISIANNKADTYITYFEGAQNPTDDVVKYVQTYAVQGNNAYVVTGSYSTKESDTNAKVVEAIIKSFSLK